MNLKFPKLLRESVSQAKTVLLTHLMADGNSHSRTCFCVCDSCICSRSDYDLVTVRGTRFAKTTGMWCLCLGYPRTSQAAGGCAWWLWRIWVAKEQTPDAIRCARSLWLWDLSRGGTCCQRAVPSAGCSACGNDTRGEGRVVAVTREPSREENAVWSVQWRHGPEEAQPAAI